MNTKNESGRMITLIVGIYLILKILLNMVLNGLNLNVGELIIAVAEALVLYAGLMFSNYVVAVLLLIVVLMHLGDNLKNLGSNLIYFLEGIIDAVCAVAICALPSVREHCSNSPSEIFGNK